jgi:hypothetical protein
MSENSQQIVTCFGCHKEFKKSPSTVRKRNFCSKDCIKGVGVQSRPMSVCHLNEPHYAKGWCYACYRANREKVNREYANEKQRTYAARHPEQIRAAQRKYLYGIKPEEFLAKFVEQEGLCAVCHTREATDVDHSHNDSQQVRDLLCGLCNRGLGCLRDCAAIVRSAAEYLEKWEARAQA